MHEQEPQTEISARADQTLGGFSLNDAPEHVDQLLPGMRLGPYRLKRKLGQGGMSTVWLADQLEPFSRQVAIKLLSRRVEDSMSQAYFLIERQALAMLVHPDIAQIYDAGQMPDGTLFFAMEYVEGRDLLDYAHSQRPDVQTLVRLFERICHAVHHAHRRGLIHRDIKPGNLMVREVDGRPLPKIIDFGIAVGSAPGQRVKIDRRVAVGTLSYMAPEQARPGDDGIDARIDVYALGITLGVALAAARGIDIDGINAASSFAISMARTAEHALETSASAVGVSLRRDIPTELRAIALCAMSPDPEQRYDSAAAMADDLLRWREQRPVLAMGQRRAYVLRCFLRRHRWASVAASLAVVALLSGILMALHGLGEARAARDVAEQRRTQAEALVGVMLGDLADRLRPLGQLDLLETVGDEAMRYLSAAASFGDHGTGFIQRAAALRTLGEVYLQRGHVERAREALGEALGTLNAATPTSSERANWHYESGQVAFWIGNLDYSAGELDAAQVQWQRYLEAAAALMRLEPERQRSEQEMSYAFSNLGALEMARGNTELALQHFSDAVEILERLLAQHGLNEERANELANIYSWMGSGLQKQGRLHEARPWLQRRVLLGDELLKDNPGAVSWEVYRALAQHLLALLDTQLGDSLAVALMTEAESSFAAAVANDPGNHVWLLHLAVARSDLGWLLHEFGDSSSGLAWQQRALELLDSEPALRADRSAVINSLSFRIRVRIAELSVALAEVELADSAFEQAAQLMAEHAETFSIAAQLAQIRLHILQASVAAPYSRSLSPEEPLQAAARVLDDLVDQADRLALLDLQTRLLLIRSDSTAAEDWLAQLQASGYQPPEFHRFLDTHREKNNVDLDLYAQ